MTQTTLVIGAAGYIGSHVVAKLNSRGIPTVGLGGRQPTGLTFERFVVGRTEMITAFIAAIRDCENVIFVGGTTRPGSPMSSVSAEIERESGHVIDIAETCAAHGVKRFVFVSSGGAVYGRSAADRIPETHSTRPISSYGLAKLVAEHGLRFVTERTGMHTISLRVANPYGPFQQVKGGQGFVAAMVHAVREGRPIEIWGDGTAVRDYIDIDDVAEAFCAAIESDASAEEINIGSGTGVTLNELIELFGIVAGHRIQVNYFPGRGVDVPRVVLDIAKAKRILGWEPRFGLTAGLEKLLRVDPLVAVAG